MISTRQRKNFIVEILFCFYIIGLATTVWYGGDKLALLFTASYWIIAMVSFSLTRKKIGWSKP